MSTKKLKLIKLIIRGTIVHLYFDFKITSFHIYKESRLKIRYEYIQIKYNIQSYFKTLTCKPLKFELVSQANVELSCCRKVRINNVLCVQCTI